MKKQIQQLEDIKAKISVEYIKRDRIHSTRSRTWRDSEKGQRYVDRTNHLVSSLSSIEDLLFNLENYKDAY